HGHPQKPGRQPAQTRRIPQHRRRPPRRSLGPQPTRTRHPRTMTENPIVIYNTADRLWSSPWLMHDVPTGLKLSETLLGDPEVIVHSMAWDSLTTLTDEHPPIT